MDSFQIIAKAGVLYEQAFLEAGGAPSTLGRLLKKFPVMYRLGWVQATIASWYQLNRKDALKYLHVGISLDNLIGDELRHEAVNSLLKQGCSYDEAFRVVGKKRFLGAQLSWSRIRDRYYEHMKRKPDYFIDQRDILCWGPTKMTFGGDIWGYNCYFSTHLDTIGPTLLKNMRVEVTPIDLSSI